ncbi:MAG: DUF6263 family protein [Planctomycetaceae bacterium]
MALALCGCGRSDVDEAEPELPAWLTEDESAAEPESIELAAADSARAPALDRAVLQLSLHPGDRFPLRKVVEQELIQASLNGVPQISRSTLELLLAITVEDVQSDRTRLSVRYDRVRYSHEVAGEQVQYDSASPPAHIPEAALAYHGMLNGGFAIDLGADNQIAGVSGFREFLDRCLQHVPADQRQRVMLDIEAKSGENGIADFVDNTIGLLPAAGDKAVGDTWEMARHIGRPIPMLVTTVYTLKGLNDSLADIGVTGTISPSTTLGQSTDSDQGVRIIVQGGSSDGHCTLYRDSGLPKESRIERIVDMTVQLAGGIEFTQQSRTVTTVESYPAQPAAGASRDVESPTPRFQ